MFVIPNQELPLKISLANEILSKGYLLIHLDPRVSDVEVPPDLRDQAQLVLKVGLFGQAIPIPDLRVDDNGIFGTLSFNKIPYTCNVPWSAIFGLVDDNGKGAVWVNDMPEEIAEQMFSATDGGKPN